MVELGGLRTKAGCDVAQALAVGQLRERHAAKLIRATEIADTMIAAVTLDDATEGLPRKMIHQLGEHQSADVHARHLCLRRRQIRAIQRSNRRHTQNRSLPQPISGLQNFDHTLLPSVCTWHNPSETRTGRPLQGDAIYLRDVCTEENEAMAQQLGTAKLLKLAAIASLAETPDTAGQILLRYREQLGTVIDVASALELLAAQAQEQLGFTQRLSYRDYMLAFEADDPIFYTIKASSDG